MAKDKQSVVTVEVKRAKKLTLQEINALVDVTIQKINESVAKHNTMIWEALKYKAAVKAMKTKHKVLKAEKELVRLKQDFPNITFSITPPKEYTTELGDFNREYRLKNKKNTLSSYSSSDDFRNIKNKLILSQADGAKSVFELAEAIAQEYLTK